MKSSALQLLNQEIVECRRCPRLVEYRESVPCQKKFQHEPCWRKPVPGFGDPKAWLLITGLAPAIQGGNRTGRIFTGDATSQFLMKALHRAGFANQPTSTSSDDGLILTGCYLTAAVKCVPPQHKPTKEEFLNCSSYYHQELLLLKKVKVILALGKLAFDAFRHDARERGYILPPMPFKHGARYHIEGLPLLYVSYHPTPRNTNTGTLTAAMFLNLLKRVQKNA